MIVKKEKKDRINAVGYPDKILIDLLGLFYGIMQKTNPTQEVSLTEDNALRYTEAATLYTDIIKQKKIKKVNWLLKFSDLHFIKDIYHQKKKIS